MTDADADADADRFNGTPDVLIHLIYSFLDMKEVLGTTLLSKKWRYLWCSLPYRNFDARMWPTLGKLIRSWEEYEKFEPFLDKVLLCRDGLDVQKLCLSYHFYSPRKLAALLYSSVKQHVQELHLSDMSLPYSFSGDVKTLVIRNCSFHKGTFTISSSTLKDLIVENSAYSSKYCGIQLCAPNLTTLQLKGGMFLGYSMGDLSALITAEIDVHITEIYSKGREESRGYFSEIFNGIHNVVSLTLPTHCFKFFPELSDGVKLSPISFNNVKHLRMTEWHGRSYVNAVNMLLGCFPNLEILVLERAEITGDSQKELNWDAVLLSCDRIFCHLKAIEIHKFDGSENERSFLEFLLNNAVTLEHITMKVTKSLSEEDAKDLVDFCKKLHIMAMASGNVTTKLITKIEGRFFTLFEESSRLCRTSDTASAL